MRLKISYMSALAVSEFASPVSELTRQVDKVNSQADTVVLDIDIQELRNAFRAWSQATANERKNDSSPLNMIHREVEYLCQ